jgi:AraC-like DNA-binding protein
LDATLTYEQEKTSERLAPFIHRYWAIKRNDHYCSHGVLPGGQTDIVFNLGEDIFEETSGNIFLHSQETAIVGPLDCHYQFRASGKFELLGARFQWGSYPYAKTLPLSAVRNRAIRLPFLIPLQNLTRRLIEIRTLSKRVELLEEVFERLSAKWENPEPLAFEAAITIDRYKGAVSMQRIALELGTTLRKIERKFHDHIGLSPKIFAATRRFCHGMKLLTTANTSSGAEVALHCGYSDQAHFIREFRRYAGRTPRNYLNSKCVGFFLSNR